VRTKSKWDFGLKKGFKKEAGHAEISGKDTKPRRGEVAQKAIAGRTDEVVHTSLGKWGRRSSNAKTRKDQKKPGKRFQRPGEEKTIPKH